MASLAAKRTVQRMMADQATNCCAPTRLSTRRLIVANIEAVLGALVLVVLASFAITIIAGTVAHAEAIRVDLRGTEEVPAVATSATGTGSIDIALDRTVSGSIRTAGVDGTAAHIHVGAKGQNGPAIITLTKTSDNEWSVPPGSQLTSEQFDSFKAGNLYVNVHSQAHRNGEIRAQLQP
jgi:hypothetical protein